MRTRRLIDTKAARKIPDKFHKSISRRGLCATPKVVLDCGKSARALLFANDVNWRLRKMAPRGEEHHRHFRL
jgi:hypothetical protein